MYTPFQCYDVGKIILQFSCTKNTLLFFWPSNKASQTRKALENMSQQRYVTLIYAPFTLAMLQTLEKKTFYLSFSQFCTMLSKQSKTSPYDCGHRPQTKWKEEDVSQDDFMKLIGCCFVIMQISGTPNPQSQSKTYSP
ncbi:unnamed protein product [Paramecium octaurelia]|uniref:Uncharacterized protein n=1 Tax=Paramecium octaurelia TaxID=43137 RepID=A0A8S1XKL8_PAROT|nr:unnamed protein product [Paramecium octaurelia]